MISSKRVSNAVGGKTARACDNCVKKRARWYCAADDAFLCQACDSSVHSANSLARRHERLRLKTSSLKLSDHIDETQKSTPSWHKGFTRKARTPRHGKHVTPHHHHKSEKPREKEKALQNPFSLVPEVGGDDSVSSHEENEDDQQLLYRVPIFDPFVAADHQPQAETTNSSDGRGVLPLESKVNVSPALVGSSSNSGGGGHDHQVDKKLHGFLPSEMDLEEFAADVESLLGRGLENECFGMEELGLVDCKEKGAAVVKMEAEDDEDVVEANKELGGGSVILMDAEATTSTEMDMMREPFELNFEDYDSPASCVDHEDDNKVGVGVGVKQMTVIKKGGSTGADEDEEAARKEKKVKKRKILLSLDYEAVIRAWDSHGSPWTTGDRPELNADDDDCWPDCKVCLRFTFFLSLLFFFFLLFVFRS